MATAGKPTKAIEINGIVKKGHFKLGMRGTKRGSAAQEVHDGDTVGLSTPLNFSSRLLGVDAPEISFTIRTKDRFVNIGDPKWTAFWTSGEWKNMPLDSALLAHLAERIGDGSTVASNHERLAKQAEKELTDLILVDQAASAATTEDFEFFLAFGYEVLDQYGRMLCYLNAERALFNPPAAPNRLSYNERLLTSGAVVPYFIFPNLQPFLTGQPFNGDAIAPAGFWKSIGAATKLKGARQAVAAARAAGKGVFAKDDPLILLPYEIRFIARLGSTGPDRYVIDLGKSGSDEILRPEHYFSITNVEDRLFIPKEFVPLFTLNGWCVR